MINQFNSFAPESKVWIYGSDRKLSSQECVTIQSELDVFTKNWSAHSQLLKAAGAVVDAQFVVIMVDENQAQVSGCGIDKSVSFMQKLGEMFSINFFNRLLVYIDTEDGIRLLSASKVAEALAKGEITAASTVYNPLVQTKAAFEAQWKIKLEDSWLKTKLATAI